MQPVGLAGFWLWLCFGLALAGLLFRMSAGFGLIGPGWPWVWFLLDLASGFHSPGFWLDFALISGGLRVDFGWIWFDLAFIYYDLGWIWVDFSFLGPPRTS